MERGEDPMRSRRWEATTLDMEPARRAHVRSRGRSGLPQLLRRVLCGCCVLYLVVLWYSGAWTQLVTSSHSFTPSAREPQTQEILRPVQDIERELQPQNPSISPAAATGQQSPPVATERPFATLALHINTEPPASKTPAQGAVDDDTPLVFADDIPEDHDEPVHDDKEPLPSEAVAAAVANLQSHFDVTKKVADTTKPRLPRAQLIDPRPQAKEDHGPEPLVVDDDAATLRPMRLPMDAAARKDGILKSLLAKHSATLAPPPDTRTPKEKYRDLLKMFEVRKEADKHAELVVDFPANETQTRRLRCVGWRATRDCDPHGHRIPASDKNCALPVPRGASGYCEIMDIDTGELFRVMRSTCTSVKPEMTFRCFEAGNFANFPALSAKMVGEVTSPNFTLPNTNQSADSNSSKLVQRQTRGILIVVYPKLVASAYASIRMLRALNCSLQIEIWYRPDEFNMESNAAMRDIRDRFGPVSFQPVDNIYATGFLAKIHAIYHSKLDQVLFLDADNSPVRDPTYLFDIPEFTSTGALFWPDFWHPEHTIFNIHPESLLWELLGMPFVDMFEQESGQIVIDRVRHASAVAMVHYYGFHRPKHLDRYKLVHGDKDLFRLAWLKIKQPFHMVQHPPGVAGTLLAGQFCGMTMVQYDPKGHLLFLHRNAAKLKGRKYTIPRGVKSTDRKGAATSVETTDPAIWTHLMQFKSTSNITTDYKIEIYEGNDAFPKGQWCYGQASPAAPHFNVFAFADLPNPDFENRLRGFAIEASDLVRPPHKSMDIKTPAP